MDHNPVWLFVNMITIVIKKNKYAQHHKYLVKQSLKYCKISPDKGQYLSENISSEVFFLVPSHERLEPHMGANCNLVML